MLQLSIIADGCVALPLQVHPNKELSEKLHKENPEQFQDKNHKPEIAVCLSDRFLGFAGIRPLVEIQSLLLSTPEIQQLPTPVKDSIKALITNPTHGDKKGDVTDDNQLIRNGFEAFIAMEGGEVQRAVKAFCARVKKEGVEAWSQVGTEISSRDKENLTEAVGILDQYNAGDGSIFVSLYVLAHFSLTCLAVLSADFV